MLRRTVLAATTVAAALAIAASAQASNWSDAITASASGDSIYSPNIEVAPDGAATVVWRSNDGGPQILWAATRPATGGAFGTPEQLSADGIGTTEPRMVSDTDGNITVAWMNASGSTYIKARTRDAATGTWGAVEEINGTVHPANDFGISANPDGTVTIGWGTYDNENLLRMRTKSATSDTWSASREIPNGEDSINKLALAFNAHGDGVVVWRAYPNGGGVELRGARYSQATDTWTEEDAPLAAEPDDVENPGVAIDDDGNAVAVWTAGQNLDVTSRHVELDAATGEWTTPANAATTSDPSMLANVVWNGRAFVLAFQGFIWDADPMVAYASSFVRTRTYDPVTKAWSAPSAPGGQLHGGAPELHVNADGDILLSMIGTADLQHPQVAVSTYLNGADGFTPETILATDDFDPWSGGVPHGAIDAAGNGYATFPQTVGSEIRAGFSFGDYSAPVLGGLSVPETGVVGQDLAFSVSPLDAWSPLGLTAWDYGDGTSGTGSATGHVYRAAGTYTVTVTASDALGNQASETRTITIASAPPANEPAPAPQPRIDPPKVLAPVIEARLNGKTVTLTANVTLRSGKSCSGKVTATTKFGTTTYRTSLKLGKVGKTCVGTGTIKLKKSPSTRTKLRVTVSAKSIKTRTLTTKRA